MEFAVLAPRAERIDLCLFDVQDGAFVPRSEVPLLRGSDGVHRGRVGGGAGLTYGLRASGPSEPGDRYEPQRLLLDPYAPQLVGSMDWTRLDGVPRGRVVDHSFAWGDDRAPRHGWRESFIYEAHVKGLTATHPELPPALRGTYLGVSHPAVIAHLRRLGVTTLELLPIQAAATEHRLQRLGLTNYWGYGTLGFFAPDPRFASVPGEEVSEVKEMVRALHQAGIEVVLDVVYNHTIEGRSEEPPLSLRGLDQRAYYRLTEDGRSVDWSGCGNSLDLGREPALRLVLDSMRAWVRDYHVDGFRFDLAPSLFRDGARGQFSAHGRFARAVAADPVLEGCKLIAEPWDLGPGGYRLGQHPARFAEWNDRFRDAARRFWSGDDGVRGELASRLAGSSELFSSPQRSINYVACHDGFPVHDLARWQRKHNEANGEANRDGSDQNHSRSWGVEGPSEDPRREALRDTVVRSLLATTLLSLGVPMLGHGDELGRTQGGNNNAYCQDNPVAWIDWSAADPSLFGFVQHLVTLRAALPQLRQADFLHPEQARWLRPDGALKEHADWLEPGRILILELHDPSAMLLLNGGDRAEPCALPPGPWRLGLDSSRPSLRSGLVSRPFVLPPHALCLLLRHEADASG